MKLSLLLARKLRHVSSSGYSIWGASNGVLPPNTWFSFWINSEWKSLSKVGHTARVFQWDRTAVCQLFSFQHSWNIVTWSFSNSVSMATVRFLSGKAKKLSQSPRSSHCLWDTLCSSFKLTRRWETAQKKKVNKKSKFKSYKSVAQRYNIFPFTSSLHDVLEEPICHSPLQKKKVLSSYFQYNYISALDQQEINIKSWKGAVNINIIHLLGSNITQ